MQEKAVIRQSLKSSYFPGVGKRIKQKPTRSYVFTKSLGTFKANANLQKKNKK